MTLLVGIDGGGTTTRCLASDDAGTRLAYARGSATNLHTVGLSQATRIIGELVQATTREAERSEPIHVVACLSGLDTEGTRMTLLRALHEAEPSVRWVCKNDAEAAWRGAFGDADGGVVAIAGTGSVALACRDGKMARAGGWGAVLGDPGSGYHIGRCALVAILRHHDGLGPMTGLEPAMLAHLDLNEATDIIDHAQLLMSPSEVAALAPLILLWAAAGDEVASAIVSSAANSLVELAAGAASRVGRADGPLPFALVGGLAADAGYVDAVAQSALARPQLLSWRKAIAEPVIGALALAASAADREEAVRAALPAIQQFLEQQSRKAVLS